MVELSDISKQLTENTMMGKALHARMDDVVAAVKEMDGTVRGNGKPGLTTRVAVVESTVEEVQRKQSATHKRLWAVLLLFVSSAVAAFSSYVGLK